MQYTSKFSGEEIDSILDNVEGKQDAIPDLETIRSNAKNASDTIARMVESGYLFSGIATIDTNPGIPDVKVFYIANGKGTYANFGGLEVTEDDVVVLYWDTAWHKLLTGIASQAKLSELEEKVDKKQDALTLTVKDNGNIVLANIQGQSKEFMPATPSGDPMHYAYVAAGAEYNDTGADIVKTTPWADMIDDDYTGDYGKTVVHKAGYWYLNGLGDITNNEMRRIYNGSIYFCSTNSAVEALRYANFRTNINLYNYKGGYFPVNVYGMLSDSNIEVVNFRDKVVVNSITYFCSKSVKFIIGQIKLDSIKSFAGSFTSGINLKVVKLNGVALNISFASSSFLSSKSILYMIQNEAATSPITITLHTDVYNRCMANANILAALETHTNISLASA